MHVGAKGWVQWLHLNGGGSSPRVHPDTSDLGDWLLLSHATVFLEHGTGTDGYFPIELAFK
jgi:hypothetical protein